MCWSEFRILLVRCFDSEDGRKPIPRHGKYSFHLSMTDHPQDQNPGKSDISRILHDQIEAFQNQYDMAKYNDSDEDEKELFIIDIGYWIKKLEHEERMGSPGVLLENSLIKFTQVPLFQHKAQLETVKILLPFLRTQMKLAEIERERDRIPKLRTNAIVPIGTTTLRELKLRTAEKTPEFAEFSDNEQSELLHKAILEVHSQIPRGPENPYMMDTDTIAAQWAQQLNENVEKYRKLLAMGEDALKAIENAPLNMPHSEKVKLQQRSTKLRGRIAEFEQWFKDCGLPIPTTTSQVPIKIPLLELCRRECEERELPKGKTLKAQEKYSIAGAIGMEGLPKLEDFKSGNPAYHRMSKMLSELGYSQKGASKYDE